MASKQGVRPGGVDCIVFEGRACQQVWATMMYQEPGRVQGASEGREGYIDWQPYVESKTGHLINHGRLWCHSFAWFALFFIAEYGNMAVMSAIASHYFLGGFMASRKGHGMVA